MAKKPTQKATVTRCKKCFDADVVTLLDTASRWTTPCITCHNRVVMRRLDYLSKIDAINCGQCRDLAFMSGDEQFFCPDHKPKKGLFE